MGKVIEFKRNEDVENIYIDQIHNYYLNNANIYRYDILDEDVFININYILFIKDFDKELKSKYIKVVKELELLDKSIVSKVILVATLTELYLYLNDKVKNFDIPTLKNILAYKVMNRTSIEDALAIYDNSNGKRM